MSQMMLWETSVTKNADGTATVKPTRLKLEGDVTRARQVLGGVDVVTTDTIYRLINAGKIKGYKPMAGVMGTRSDGQASSAKYVIDLNSCYDYRARCLERSSSQ